METNILDSFGSVGERNWNTRPVFVVGGGPSLKPHMEKLKTLHEKGFVIAVNDGYKHCTPDAVITLDDTWFAKRYEEIKDIKCPVYVCTEPEKVMDTKETIPNLVFLLRVRRAKETYLSRNPQIITNGLNSGFGGYNLAYLKGAKVIYLLGFDFNRTTEGATHFHEGYSWHDSRVANLLYHNWTTIFDDTLAQVKQDGVKVYNCNVNSHLKCFEFAPYETVI